MFSSLFEDDKNIEDDEDMLELEANKANVETNIAALLEDEEVVEVVDSKPSKMTSSLPMILKVGVNSSKKHYELYFCVYQRIYLIYCHKLKSLSVSFEG